MIERTEIRLSGSGGQGLILAGIILAEAAILDGKNAVQSQSYGPEARGGASRAEVIISTSNIDYPKVDKPDVLLALTEEAMLKYKNGVKQDGIVIVDSSVKKPVEDCPFKIVYLPILDTAQNKVGKTIVANIVALGVLTEVTNVVSRTSVEKAVLDKVPQGTKDLNKKALHAGFELGRNL